MWFMLQGGWLYVLTYTHLHGTHCSLHTVPYTFFPGWYCVFFPQLDTKNLVCADEGWAPWLFMHSQYQHSRYRAGDPPWHSTENEYNNYRPKTSQVFNYQLPSELRVVGLSGGKINPNNQHPNRKTGCIDGSQIQECWEHIPLGAK